MFLFLLNITIAVIVLSTLTAVMALWIFPSINYSLKLLSLYLVVGTCVDVLSYAYSIKDLNNLFFFHFFSFFEFWILTFTFESLFFMIGKSINLKPVALIGRAIILLNSIFFQKLDTFNSYSATFVSIAVLTYCIYYFNLFLDNPSEMIQMRTIKWIVISVFLFHSVSVVVLLFSNIMLGLDEFSQNLVWTIRCSMILIIKFVLFITYFKLTSFIFKKPAYE